MNFTPLMEYFDGYAKVAKKMNPGNGGFIKRAETRALDPIVGG